jgi:hypothetical protein
MKIYRVRLTKEKLAAMPEAERSLLLLLGHATNEISVLSKLILMARKDEPTSKLIDHVESGQIFILMRVLIGKLHEAWRLFEKRFQRNPTLVKKYLPKLSPEAAAALNDLKNHFGRRSPLTSIRNEVSFHYTDDKNLTEANFKRLPETEPWEFYISEAFGNSFFFASELVIQGGVISLAGGKSHPNAVPTNLSFDTCAIAKLGDTVITVSRQITELFSDLIPLIVKTSIGEDVETTTEEIPDGPKISTLSLPFFIDWSDSQQRRRTADPTNS